MRRNNQHNRREYQKPKAGHMIDPYTGEDLTFEKSPFDPPYRVDTRANERTAKGAWAGYAA